MDILLQIDQLITVLMKIGFFVLLIVLLYGISKGKDNLKKIGAIIPLVLIVKFVEQSTIIYLALKYSSGFGQFLFQAGRASDVIRELGIDLVIALVIAGFVTGVFYLIRIIKPQVLSVTDMWLLWIVSVTISSLNYAYPLINMVTAMVIFLGATLVLGVKSGFGSRRPVGPYILVSGITIFIFDFFAKLAKLNLPF